MSAVLEVEDLKVYRGKRLVLDVPSLAVEEGEVLAVIGPNGAGKSTLLEALALLTPASMTYRFGGRTVRLPDEALALRRQMAVVFQRPLLLDGTVFDNVALGLRLRRVPEAEVRQRVNTWLERFGVAHLARRHSWTLSGGEAQRVSLARALVLQPRVLFLDEPFGPLDVLTRSAILQDLRAILRSAGVTALFVTHDFTEIPPMADRVAVLMEGRIRQTGTPREVFARPADDAVRQLVRAAADLVRLLE
ncbi:MAG TPA: ATP-binding cassette domain-containing protein [Symbiobacteriaceae bacterium]